MKSKIKIFIVLAFSTFFTFINCTDELELTNPNSPTPESFWQTEEHAEGGLTAVYAPLPTIPMFGRILVGIHLIHRSDIANPFPQSNVNDAGALQVRPENPRVSEIYQEWYKMVARANQVISRVPAIDMDATRKQEILGEAHFLRGFAYFYIVNLWGTSPLSLEEAVSLEELFLPNSTIEQTYAAIINDFTIAQASLPQDGRPPKGEVGRATWGAATAFLGRSYLYTGDFSKAAIELKKVKDSGIYDLNANYNDNFIEEISNTPESIFEIQYDGNETGGWGGAGGNVYRAQAWEADVAPRNYSSQQSMSVNQWVLDLFLSEQTTEGTEDPRAKATLLWNYPGAMIYQDAFEETMLGDDLNRVWVRKYLNFRKENALTPGSWQGATNNWKIFRYSDLLLMYAEAENEVNGGSQNAIDALNEVRDRVSMPNASGLNQSQLRQAIRDERVKELAIEGNRFFDLNRWGIAAERFGQNPDFRSNSQGVFVEGRDEYLPIPAQDVQSNSNLNQNPGY
ncbi:RagB/SusD family nutrient uptake outer membrane protein [uncultured Maribacter sp.]|uniref:RagB/SusD family nutrient uptake outer membrane protein n=1 Tax=uncultured Maribacter sp. TaxID=431308 RepID=UPI0030ECE6F3|tara:strand:- start:69341 stop:70873 length:1533 start_codon:yes stop_codon:yes gene_type:complete